ncbi:hypothetical protein NA57DRAFT_74429 [Rhizodiscina lignyota]|uniref:BTB domain-containing protein n=1 Tax=Rhizodiscina lignyota TaxID=1504668 RepID=A0A9P4IKC0_9PEZI|nr:hypothetical protein NA57DRAFT_74429 [Rhizodiscina lignyota]
MPKKKRADLARESLNREPSFENGKIGPCGIMILAGPEKKPFLIHKDLVAHYSPYFRFMIEGHPWRAWVAGEDSSIPLEDVNPATVGLFQQWLYSSKLPNPVCDRPHDDIHYTRSDIEATSLHKTVLLYTFAEQYDTPALKLATMNWILRYVTVNFMFCYPWYETVIVAFAKLEENDPLRRLFIELYADRWTGFEEDAQLRCAPRLPSDFTYGVMKLKG